MPNVPDDQLIPLSFAKGIHNRSEETKAPADTARALVNLDLAPGGVPTVREGFQLRLPMTGAHSLWTDPKHLPFALFVQDDALLMLHPTFETTVLRTGLARRAMHYAYVAGRVYFSNDVDTGTITPAGALAPWGVETPAPNFAVLPAAEGGLPAGQYQVALTFVADREESGAAAPQAITLEDGQGITLTGLPTPRDAHVTALRVYLSAPNDPRLLLAREVAIGMPSVTLGNGARGRRLDTLFLQPAAPGRYLLPCKGRLYGASGRLLRWTEALRYGLTDPANNYRVMPEAISGIGAPESQGFTLYVGTPAKVYQLQGEDMPDAKLTAVGHAGMVPGSLIHVGPEALGMDTITAPCPVWLGTNGQFYVGTPMGVLPLNQGVVATAYRQAATLVREQDGAHRLVVAGQGGKTPGLAFRDKVVARVEP